MQSQPAHADSGPLTDFAIHFTRGYRHKDEVDEHRGGIRVEEEWVPDLCRRPLPHRPNPAEEFDDGSLRSLSILSSGEVRASWCWPNVAYGKPHSDHAWRGASFTTSPVHMLQRLLSTRSGYGVGFRRSFLKQRGAKPVEYLRRDTPEANAAERRVTEAVARGAGLDDPVWESFLFTDLIDDEYDTSDEREWRVPGPLCFDEDDVAFLVIPERLHFAARAFFEDVAGPAGPAPFQGPYIDISWEEDRIAESLANPPAPPDPANLSPGPSPWSA